MILSDLRKFFFKSQDFAKKTDAAYWQQLVFSVFSTLIIVGGLFLTFHGIKQFITDGNYIMVGVDAFFYGAILTITLNRRFSFGFRKRAISYSFLIIGTTLMVVTGPFGGSSTYIFCSFVSAGLFEDRRGLIIHIILSVSAYLLLTFTVFSGLFLNSPIQLLQSSWSVVFVNNVLLGIVVEILVYNVTHGLLQQTDELQNQQEYLELIFNSALQPMMTIDRKNVIMKVNRHGVEFFRLGAEELVGKNLFSLITLTDYDLVDRLKEMIHTVNRGSQISGISEQTRIEDAGGRAYQVILSISPMYAFSADSERHIPTGAVVSFHDITEEHAREKQLKQYEWLTEKSSDKLAKAYQGAIPPYGDLTELNTDRHIIDSIGKETLTAYAREMVMLLDSSISIFEKNGDYALSMVISDWCRLLDEVSRANCNTEDNQVALDSGNWFCHECRWTHNGKLVIETGEPVESTSLGDQYLYGVPIKMGEITIGAITIGYGSPPRDPEKLQKLSKMYRIPIETLQRLAMTYRPRPQYIIDIEKYRLQTIAQLIGEIVERKHTARELDKIQNLKRIGYLAGGIAHDFNNILTGIYGYISIAKTCLSEDSEASGLLEQAESSMDRATNLTKRLLTFAKGGNPIKEILDTETMIRDIVGFELSGSSVEAVFSIDERPYLINADKTQMEQVLSNIVHNAVQAMPKGGRLRIRLKNLMIKDDPFIEIGIEDEGIGIPKESIELIFDPFYSLKENGTGIGLATVQSIINKHNGKISVTSEVGVGSTFTIILPAMMETDGCPDLS